MYLTQQSEYALKVLIYVAVNPDQLVQISQIAETYHISKSHLMKVVTCLVKGGFLIGVRGKGGGLKLAKKTDAVVIGEVIRWTENLQIIRNTDKQDCTIKEACRLEPLFQTAIQDFIQHLDRYTLADLLAPTPDFQTLLSRTENKQIGD